MFRRKRRGDAIVVAVFILLAIFLLTVVIAGNVVPREEKISEARDKNFATNLVSLYKLAEADGSPLNMYVEFKATTGSCTLVPDGVMFEKKTMYGGEHYLPYEESTDVVTTTLRQIKVENAESLLPYVIKIKDNYYIVFCIDPHSHKTYVVSKMEGRKDASLIPLKNRVNLELYEYYSDSCIRVSITPDSIISLPIFTNIEND